MAEHIDQNSKNRRLPIVAVATQTLGWFVAVLILALYAQPAFAQEMVQDSSDEIGSLSPCEPANQSSQSNGPLHIVKVAGLIDQVVTNNLLSKLSAAEAVDSAGYIIWLDSADATISPSEYKKLANRLHQSPVETGIWVGNSSGNRSRGNSRATGHSAELAASVNYLALAPGAVFGAVGDPHLPARFNSKFASHSNKLTQLTFDAETAISLGVSEGPLERNADIKAFIASFPDAATITCLTDIDGVSRQIKQLQTPTQISGLSMGDQLFHTASSPQVAYIFFVLGMALIVFEFFTAGVGVAGITGAGLFLLGSYGLGNLPVNSWALTALVISMLCFGIDIQTNMPRFYSAVGMGLFTLGSYFLYQNMFVSWLTFSVSIISAAIFAYSAMPAMVRARFSTPTIGREHLIGGTGVAVSDISPSGTIEIDGAQWKALTNRATPISKGQNVVVIGIKHLTVEVEPTEGAARDHRRKK